jgi:hypothetical protein
MCVLSPSSFQKLKMDACVTARAPNGSKKFGISVVQSTRPLVVGFISKRRRCCFNWNVHLRDMGEDSKMSTVFFGELYPGIDANFEGGGTTLPKKIKIVKDQIL